MGSKAVVRRGSIGNWRAVALRAQGDPNSAANSFLVLENQNESDLSILTATDRKPARVSTTMRARVQRGTLHPSATSIQRKWPLLPQEFLCARRSLALSFESRLFDASSAQRLALGSLETN